MWLLLIMLVCTLALAFEAYQDTLIRQTLHSYALETSAHLCHCWHVCFCPNTRDACKVDRPADRAVMLCDNVYAVPLDRRWHVTALERLTTWQHC